jgi:LEA14-like dessication related protein
MLRRLFSILLALGLAACAALPPKAVAPRVRVAEVSVRQLDLFEQRFAVALQVENPNDFELTIEALEFELEVNGRPFATGASHEATRIPAAATTLLPVEVVMHANDLVRQLKALPNALKSGVPYRIRGRVKTDRSPTWLPFDHSGTYGGDTKSRAGRAP